MSSFHIIIIFKLIFMQPNNMEVFFANAQGVPCADKLPTASNNISVIIGLPINFFQPPNDHCWCGNIDIKYSAP